MAVDAPDALKACKGRTKAMIVHLLREDFGTQAIIDRVCRRLSLRKSDLQLSGDQLYNMLSHSAHGVRSQTTAETGGLVLDLSHFGPLECAAMGIIMERCLLEYVAKNGDVTIFRSPYK